MSRTSIAAVRLRWAVPLLAATVLAGAFGPARPAAAQPPLEPAPSAAVEETVGEDAPVEPGPAPEDFDGGTETVSAVVVTGDGAEVISREVAPSEVPEATADLRRERGVLSVSVDTRASIFTADPRRSDQWGLDDLALSQLSPGAPDGDGLLVAVVDTGVDATHPDLAGRIRCDLGADFVAAGGGDGCTDPHGHGTFVAGEISALSDNGIDISGVSNASIIPIRVLDEEGWGDASAIAAGIVEAVDKGADVVNLSLGGPANAAFDAAVDYAVDNDVIVVAAAGNNRQEGNEVSYPAASPGAISVAATDEDGLSASFSYSGPTVDVSAPGTNILSTVANTGSYDYLDGTSMAAAYVSGVLVRVREAHPSDPVSAIEGMVQTTAIDMENPGRDNDTGYGMLDTRELLMGLDGSLPAGRATDLAGAPTLGQLTIGSGAVYLRWAPPSYVGPASAIDGYTVYAFRWDPVAEEFALHGYVDLTPTARSYLVSGLANGREYVFVVAAFTEFGEGQWAESDILTPLAPTVPAAPVITATTPGPTSVVVGWTAPDEGRSPIQRYIVRAFRGTSVVATVIVGGRSATVTGLANGTGYTFDVRAQNAVGTGPASARSAVVVPRTRPTAPQILTPAAGSGRVSVRWSAPSSNGGAAITGYSVRTYRGTTLVSTVTVPGSATSAVVTGLSNGVAYTFVVYATNIVGTSPASALSPVAVPRDRPGAPPLGAVTPGNGVAYVRWGAAASNGAAITGYVVRVYRNGTPVTAPSAAGTARAILIGGLVNGATYTYTVTAYNAAGAGPPSATGTVVPTA